jgi:hypothetical protein
MPQVCFGGVRLEPLGTHPLLLGRGVHVRVRARVCVWSCVRSWPCIMHRVCSKPRTCVPLGPVLTRRSVRMSLLCGAVFFHVMAMVILVRIRAAIGCCCVAPCHSSSTVVDVLPCQRCMSRFRFPCAVRQRRHVPWPADLGVGPLRHGRNGCVRYVWVSALCFLQPILCESGSLGVLRHVPVKWWSGKVLSILDFGGLKVDSLHCVPCCCVVCVGVSHGASFLESRSRGPGLRHAHGTSVAYRAARALNGTLSLP